MEARAILRLTNAGRPEAPEFELDIENTGSGPLELVEIDTWNTNLPDRLFAMSNAQGELRVRAVGMPEAAEQEFDHAVCGRNVSERVVSLAPGVRRRLRIALADLDVRLCPGEYDVSVRVFDRSTAGKHVESNVVRIAVAETHGEPGPFGDYAS